MKTAEVMFVMPVSITVTVEVPDDATPDDAIAAAEAEMPSHNSMGCGWDSADPDPFDSQTGKPHMVVLDGEDVTEQWAP